MLADKQVIIYADNESYAILQGNYPAELLCHAVEESFGCEFLDYKLAVKLVADIDVAIAHILKWG
jgi:glutamate-5-semialdehyde dehydrogenase